MIRVGYIRASTDNQKLSIEEQKHQLASYGVDEEHMFIDAGVSGMKNTDSDSMRALFKFIEECSEEVEVVVTKLDRWGRDYSDLEINVKRVESLGGAFTSLAEGINRINSKNSGGMLLFRIFAAIAAMEREKIAERNRESLSALRRRGVPLGPPPVLSSQDIAWIKERHADGWGATRIANNILAERNVKTSRSTIARVLGYDKSRPAYVPKDNHKYTSRESARLAKETTDE